MTDGIGPTGVTPLGHEVFQIDTRMAGYEGITAGYLIRGDRPCLVETGTAPSAPVVRDALAALGIGPADLATVVVTHIHLDHAGGAGDIAAMFPAAQIVVHQRGARHLADPSKLMAGARMVYGRALERLFGVLAPVPAERIVALDDTGTVDLGGGRASTATTPPATPSITSAWSTLTPGTCTSATRPGCTCRTPGMSGRRRRRPTSTWRLPWPRYASSPRCARPG